MAEALAIRAERLGKRYRTGGGAAPERYRALRDVPGSVLRTLAGDALGRLQGRRAPLGEGPEAFWALRDVDFTVRQGEVVGVIGPNGAGKSTLLKVLSRITEPTEGRVSLRGRVASLLEVGAGFHPELTGRENIRLNGAVLGMTGAEVRRRFDEIVAFSEVGDFLDTPVKRYSSGMYVRLAFAVAAHLEPDILVVDEVLAVGDAAFQRKCLGKIGEVARHGRTVLFVSHNMAAVQRLCDTALVLDRGRVVHRGEPAEAIARYLADGGAGERCAWTRPAGRPPDPAGFVSASLEVLGAQPALSLRCRFAVRVARPCARSIALLDIVDPLGAPVMQAEPAATPFVPGEPGVHAFEVTVDLPPLIPGRYGLGLRLIPAYTERLDVVESALAFEVTDAPVAGRSHPYTAHHGYVIPTSRWRALGADASESAPAAVAEAPA